MKELVNVFAENPSQENLIKLLQSDTCTALLDRYDQFTECTRRGEHGKTAMFWLSYIDFVHIYLLLDYAVHTNDVDLYIHALGLMCPVFFATHRPNYARWMAKFHLNLMNMENTHKGVRAIFEGGALSIRRTGKNFARSAADLTLEQTVNKDAASRQGGITAFTQCVEARKRWTLTRAFRGAVVSSLLEMVGLSHGETTSQDLKPYRIRRDNRDLRSVLISLEETMNPFQENLPDLYCLATGRAASAEVQEDLTSIIAKGREWHQEFTEECRADPKRFEKPIKRRKVKNFTKDVLCGKIVGKDKKLKEIRYTRDIFGRLLYLAISMELDLAEVLAYPLTEVPLSLCHLSGAMNKTDKSALMRKLEAKGTENSEPTEIDAYILDTMFFLRTLPELPPTFGGIATLILQNACTYAHTVHIVCDTYKDGASIKEHERQERGNYEARFQITGPSQRRPANFHQALLSASFKTALLQFLKDEWMSISYAKMLEGHDVYFALEGCCYLYTCQDGAVNVQEVRELRSEHEEADTRIIFHADYIMKQSEIPPTVAIRSCDTDVFILLLYHQNHINSKFWMDTGTSSKNTRRMINIAELAQMVTPQVCCALPAFHAFTGCDYTGSFLRKAKAKPYDRMIKNPKYLSAFSDLGNSESVCTKTEAVIEEFVCRMYGVQVEKDVNRTRFHLFKKLYAPKNLENPLNIIKSTDPCCLPPCKDVLRQKLKRTNYVAHLWKGARKAKPIAYSPEGSGWRNTDTKHLEIVWFQGPRSPSKLSAAVAEDPSFNDEDEDDDDDDENLTYSISSDEEDDDDSDYE